MLRFISVNFFYSFLLMDYLNHGYNQVDHVCFVPIFFHMSIITISFIVNDCFIKLYIWNDNIDHHHHHQTKKKNESLKLNINKNPPVSSNNH